jgi:peptidoglycan/xylan/chitin deacetylase (PgdA/CDA1 family)
MQLIFDEKQKDGNNQIWIDVYNIVKLLEKHRAPASKEPSAQVKQTDTTVVYGEYDLPVIMYHGILEDTRRSGQYIITPRQLEEDFRHIRDSGYTAITSKELIDFVDHGIPLPDKPIMLTFDDGMCNNCTYMMPLLEKYDLKAVVSVIGVQTDCFSESSEKPNDNYSCLTYEQLGNMLATGRIEIANHTYDMHGGQSRMGVRMKPGETKEQFMKTAGQDILKLQSRLLEELGYVPVTFTYPYGYITNNGRELIRSLPFRVTLSCEEGVNKITREEDSIYLLKRYNRPAEISTYRFFRQFE